MNGLLGSDKEVMARLVVAIVAIGIGLGFRTPVAGGVALVLLLLAFAWDL